MNTDSPNTSSKFVNLYNWVIIVLGAGALAITIPLVNLADLGFPFLIFGLVTLVVASRIVVRIPKIDGHISVSDTFIFLSILLFGGEAGIILATFDGVVASARLAKSKTTFIFNIAVYALSAFVTVWSLRVVFGRMPSMAQREFTTEYVIAICLMAVVQYVVNSGLIAVAVALRENKPIWKMWVDSFLWTSLTYFAGASAAGIIAKLVGIVGIYAFLAGLPIVAVVYFTYTTYLKNVEAAALQANLAEKHVNELSHHIAEQERIAQALKESEQYFRNAFDHAAGMAVVGTDGKWLQVNESLCKMLGYSKTELLKLTFQNITDPADLGIDLAHFQSLLENKETTYQLEKRFSHKFGTTLWVLQSASLIRDNDGKPRHVIFQIQNISDRKLAEDLIRHAAFHDALTGLPNRTLFTDRLSMAIERAKRSSDFKFAVLFLDLDRFKVLNDSLGHDSGDKLLVDLSRRLEKCVRTVDSVARLGGDEFVILLDGIVSIVEATTIAERIQESLKTPFDFEGQKFFTTASMGIACSTQNYERPEDVLRDADTAMYKAKSAGKARHELFDSHMHTRAVQALTVENELRHALQIGDILPYYQAIVSLRSGETVGFEALARWIHLERGLVPPADFVPLAEECGLIVPIGQSILMQACQQGSMWCGQFTDRELTICVNLSAKQFRQTSLISDVEHVLNETNFNPRFLKLEITETMVIEDIVSAVEMLKHLKKLGVQIAIDDFGTGYSSLSYLHRFPFDALKIDRSFVKRMTKDRESRGIVKTITTLAHELDKVVIAEGVETTEQRQILTDFGCELGQGFLFSKPINADAASEILISELPWDEVEILSGPWIDTGASVEEIAHLM
ncbi:MAG: putative bifunctional diguanylate cyclase/phosphodiesterase [Pyrinomonadaceae bacterium]